MTPHTQEPADQPTDVKRSAFDVARETLQARYGTLDPALLAKLGACPVELGAAEQIANRDAASGARPFAELRSSGLLWLINRVVFHPRGFALGLVLSGDEAIGWRLGGDGTEPWKFNVDEDALFAAVEAALRAARPLQQPPAAGAPLEGDAGSDTPLERCAEVGYPRTVNDTLTT